MLESTRRRWCRLVFLAIGVAPTASLLATAGYLRSATHRQAVEFQLQSAVGLAVSVGQVAHPLPGGVRLSDVAWSDAETGATLGRANRLDFFRKGVRWEVEGGDVVLDAAQGPLLAETLQRALRVPSRAQPSRISIRVRSLHWMRGEERFSCGQLTGSLEPNAGGTTGQVQFLRPGRPGDQPAQVRVVRDRSISPPATRWDVHCNGTPLPAWLLLAGADSPMRLGSQAEFNGYLWASRSATGWEGQLTGRLRGVDLTALLGEDVPRLTGSADLSINLLRVQQGRAHRLDGAISAGPGEIDPALALNLSRELGLPVGRRMQSETAEMVAFRELSAAVLLDDQGLTIRGGCGGRADSRVLLHAEDGPLVGETRGPVAVAALLKGLSPAPDAWQAGSTVHWLTQHLALSSPRPAIESQRSPQHAEVGRQLPSPGGSSRKR